MVRISDVAWFRPRPHSQLLSTISFWDGIFFIIFWSFRFLYSYKHINRTFWKYKTLWSSQNRAERVLFSVNMKQKGEVRAISYSTATCHPERSWAQEVPSGLHFISTVYSHHQSHEEQAGCGLLTDQSGAAINPALIARVSGTRPRQSTCGSTATMWTLHTWKISLK